ncbi:MAG TPA: hypothetical protein DCM28_20570 [Phycisphaerales bacterium]|nr:hypothetical protein [Phycisphaerales bacterium]HCD34348.1 hypothetical protein [Phycisphaerales bacterium]|tara:strand:- start:3145 stop:4569 length:1425 start_codon:yes stop_codon:yes gene_type:complete
MRGFMLDSARVLESRAYYRRFIDFIAQRGCDTLLWHFTDDQGCSLQFDALNGCASPNAYTKDQLRELITYAQTKGIMMIPELETLGHTRYITRASDELAELSENNAEFTAICPVAPRTQEIIAALLDEVCELFDCPFVHVGMDEVNFGDHPLTQKALQNKTQSQIFADHLQFLHQHLAKHDRRMMMWADHIIKDTAIAAELPRDVIMANWQYDPIVPWQTTQTLLDMGFDVVLCSSMISHAQTLHPGKSYALPNLTETARQTREHDKILGSIVTIWTPQRFLHDALWPAVDYAAAMLKKQGYVPLAETLPSFAKTFYGFEPSATWINAMQTLFDHTPMRRPWVAAMRLETGDDLQGIDLQQEANCWQEVHDVLAGSRDDVTDNAEAYDTLVLMIRMMRHVWLRLLKFNQNTCDESLLAESQAIEKALGQTWDRERFADDPRKMTPVFSFDEVNHLLLMFTQGTERLQENICLYR